MLKKVNAVLVASLALLLVAGPVQLAGAAAPNLGRAPGESGDNVSGLVTEVVLPQLGLGNTGQALSGPILDYLGVEVPDSGGLVAGLVELANGNDDLLMGPQNVAGQAPEGTLAGDVVLPTLRGLEAGQRPGEVLPAAIREYLELNGLGGDDLAVAFGAEQPEDFAPVVFVSSPLLLGATGMAIPEPVTMSLLGIGAVALLRRRK